VLCDLWGTSQRPFVTVRTPNTMGSIIQFDIAPSATPHLFTHMATPADT
jgi:hypothetical protein